MFDLERESCNYSFSFRSSRPDETTYEIRINIAGSTQAAFGRYLGCIMIGLMPDEGLEEAVLSLRDMLKFHSHKPTSYFARLTPKAIDATITDKKKRPDLVIT